jgi:putative heme degradation protein
MPVFLENFIENAGFDTKKIDKDSVLKTVQFYDTLIEIINKVMMKNPNLLKSTIEEIQKAK